MRYPNNLENKISLYMLKSSGICVKIQVHSSLEQTLEYNQEQTPLRNKRS